MRLTGIRGRPAAARDKSHHLRLFKSFGGGQTAFLEFVEEEREKLEKIKVG